MQLIEGIKIITFWGLASNIKQQSNKWTTIGDWQGEAKTKWFLNMNPCNSKQNRGFFSKGKWEAIDMLVDHESGTDNQVDEVNDRWWD